jgi:hypothetical protein
MSPVASAGVGSLVISSLRISAPNATDSGPAGSVQTSPDILASAPYILVLPTNAVPLKFVAWTCAVTSAGVGPKKLTRPLLRSG